MLNCSRATSRLRRPLPWLGFEPVPTATWLSPHERLDQIETVLTGDISSAGPADVPLPGPSDGLGTTRFATLTFRSSCFLRTGLSHRAHEPSVAAHEAVAQRAHAFVGAGGQAPGGLIRPVG